MFSPKAHISFNIIPLFFFTIFLGKATLLHDITLTEFYSKKAIENLSISDELPSLKLIYPNGGEIWERGKAYTIRWELANDPRGIGIDLLFFKPGQSTIRRSLIAQTPNDGQFSYIVPSDFNRMDWSLKIEIYSLDEKERDQSDGFFRIQRGSGLDVQQQALSLGTIIGVLKGIYDVVQKAKAFYDENISQTLSEEEIRFRTLMEEMNDLHLRQIISKASSAIEYYAFASSIDPEKEGEAYEELLRTQLAVLVGSGLEARDGIRQELRARNRPARYSVKLAELQAVLTPVLAAAGRGLGWSDSKIKSEILEDAFESNFSLLGPASSNHPCLPFYSIHQGKLYNAFKSKAISAEEYERLRVITWNSQELLKDAADIECKYAFWIRSNLTDKNGFISAYNQCLTRSEDKMIAEDCQYSKSIGQLWSFDATEQGFIKIKFIKTCLARNGNEVFMENCNPDSEDQSWEWIGGHIVAPAKSTNKIDNRMFLYINPDGSLMMKPETLPNTRAGEKFPYFRVYHNEEPSDNKTQFLGYRNKRRLSQPFYSYESKNFQCPIGTSVQGIVGGNNVLNNFGLICAPLREDWRSRPTSNQQLASATVLSFGTSAVNGYTTNKEGDPFWYYYNGITSGNLTNGIPLSINYKLCTFGSINSIKTHLDPGCGDGGICGLENFTCVRGSLSDPIVLPRGKFGELLPGSYPYQIQKAICPTHDNYITGVTIFRQRRSMIGGYQCDCRVKTDIIADVVGDKDGFGLGLKDGDVRPVSQGSFNERHSSDPNFTDARSGSNAKFSYTHTFNVGRNKTIRRAQINLLALGIQDGDNDLSTGETGYWTHSFSEEQGSVIARPGYYLAGYRCSGNYCDNRQLYFRSYPNFDRDQGGSTAQGWTSYAISEEKPNNQYTARQGYLIAGEHCSGRYCDNIKFFTARNREADLTIDKSRQFWTTNWFSEEQNPSNEYIAPEGHFIVGYECSGSYCDNRRFLVAPLKNFGADIKVFIDGEEIPYALDKVDQFKAQSSQWVETVGLVYIIIPDDMLDYLEDGKINVTIETTNHSGGSRDVFAIDYSELLIETER